ncbi:MAG: hydrogenase maturation protease [Lysobacterales bacterium]|jgi:hydrogenase 3 maturation protease
MDKNLAEQLCDFVHGKVCVMGIGNRHWHDDGIGSYVAEALDACPGLDVVDAGFVPENHLEEVAQRHPDCILMVDATDFGGEPGQARLIFPDKVAYSGVSTHAGSLRMLAEYMRERTQAPVALLAIQPDDTSAGESLSPAVAETFRDLMENLPEVCKKRD